MRANPYLNFAGTCAEAFRLYAELLGGKIEMELTHGGTPMADNVPADWHDKIMHIQMRLPEGDLLMGSDAPPNYYVKPEGFSVSLQLSDPAEAERLYTGLSEGGEIRMELQKTFWAERFAMFSDHFGIPWIINCETAA